MAPARSPECHPGSSSPDPLHGWPLCAVHGRWWANPASALPLLQGQVQGPFFLRPLPPGATEERQPVPCVLKVSRPLCVTGEPAARRWWRPRPGHALSARSPASRPLDLRPPLHREPTLVVWGVESTFGIFHSWKVNEFRTRLPAKEHTCPCSSGATEEVQTQRRERGPSVGKDGRGWRKQEPRTARRTVLNKSE